MLENDPEAQAVLRAVRNRRISAWRRGFWITTLVFFVLGFGGTATGFILGLHLVMYAGFALYGLAGLFGLIVWGVVFFGLRREREHRRLRSLLIATVVWWGLTIAVVLLCVVPVYRAQDGVYLRRFEAGKLTADAYRAKLHWALIWNPDPGFGGLYGSVPAETSSMPYILWALRWTSLEENELALTILQEITYHDADDTRADWQKWYAENKHLRPEQWLLNALAEAGCPVSADNEVASIRSLFRCLGKRKLSGNGPIDNGLRRAANDRLSKSDVSLVKETMLDTLSIGTVDERRGAVRYAKKSRNDDKLKANVVGALQTENDRSVRLAAGLWLHDKRTEQSNRIVHPLPNGPRWGTPELEAFLAPDGADVLPVRLASGVVTGQQEVLAGNASAGLPTCALVVQVKQTGQLVEAFFSVEGVAPDSEAVLYTTAIHSCLRKYAPTVEWLVDEDTHRLYTFLPDYMGGVDLTDGRLLWEMGFDDAADYVRYTGFFQPLRESGLNRRAYRAYASVGGYLLIIQDKQITVFGAQQGHLLAVIEVEGCRYLTDYHCVARLSLVNGKLRVASPILATGTSNSPVYEITLPELPE